MQTLIGRLSSGQEVLMNRLQSATWKRTRHFEGQMCGEDADALKSVGAQRDVASGLLGFTRDFLLTLDGMIDMTNRLLEVVRSIDPTWLEDSASGECKAQVWALTMAIKATTPRVSAELKHHITGLERVVESTKIHQALLERKAKYQMERNHYMLKLQVLKEEVAERDNTGRQPSAEQMQRIGRNEDKLCKAQRDLDEATEAANAVVKGQAQRSRTAILSALHGVAKIAACGWFASTGAVVCRALQSASEAGARASSNVDVEEIEPKEESSQAGVVVLPLALADDRFEPPARFDPHNPLAAESGTVLPEPSGLAENLAAVASCEEQEESAEQEQPSVSDLRERLLRESSPHAIPSEDAMTSKRRVSNTSKISRPAGSSTSAPSKPSSVSCGESATLQLNLPKPKSGLPSRRASRDAGPEGAWPSPSAPAASLGPGPVVAAVVTPSASPWHQAVAGGGWPSTPASAMSPASKAASPAWPRAAAATEATPWPPPSPVASAATASSVAPPADPRWSQHTCASETSCGGVGLGTPGTGALKSSWPMSPDSSIASPAGFQALLPRELSGDGHAAASGTGSACGGNGISSGLEGFTPAGMPTSQGLSNAAAAFVQMGSVGSSGGGCGYGGGPSVPGQGPGFAPAAAPTVDPPWPPVHQSQQHTSLSQSPWP
eukprot:TRINITY_DN42092_c0_g1_i1.p1 TRINITY_DN42092_c0_g1~~TRINITY_DN42092_c0_g1_i1.p1  ORF type:complete len:665 (-),score=104.20 TRINITY_DN42092_c0_g1_i1:168-2162(-)